MYNSFSSNHTRNNSSLYRKTKDENFKGLFVKQSIKYSDQNLHKK